MCETISSSRAPFSRDDLAHQLPHVLCIRRRGLGELWPWAATRLQGRFLGLLHAIRPGQRRARGGEIPWGDAGQGWSDKRRVVQAGSPPSLMSSGRMQPDPSTEAASWADLSRIGQVGERRKGRPTPTPELGGCGIAAAGRFASQPASQPCRLFARPPPLRAATHARPPAHPTARPPRARTPTKRSALVPGRPGACSQARARLAVSRPHFTTRVLVARHGPLVRTPAPAGASLPDVLAHGHRLRVPLTHCTLRFFRRLCNCQARGLQQVRSWPLSGLFWGPLDAPNSRAGGVRKRARQRSWALIPAFDVGVAAHNEQATWPLRSMGSPQAMGVVADPTGLGVAAGDDGAPDHGAVAGRGVAAGATGHWVGRAEATAQWVASSREAAIGHGVENWAKFYRVSYGAKCGPNLVDVAQLFVELISLGSGRCISGEDRFTGSPRTWPKAASNLGDARAEPKFEIRSWLGRARPSRLRGPRDSFRT